MSRKRRLSDIDFSELNTPAPEDASLPETGSGSGSDTNRVAVLNQPAEDSGSPGSGERAHALTLSGFENARDSLDRINMKTVQILEVDPNLCEVLPWHDRLWDELNEETCADLIDGFRRAGGQRIPVFARLFPADSPQYAAGKRYEIIAGARRLWTARYLNTRLIVRVVDVDDLEAFRLADIENRARKNTSPYEQGVWYAKLLDTLFEGNQSRLADEVGITRQSLREHLLLATLPKELLSMCDYLTEIPVKKGSKLAQLIQADNAFRKRVLEEIGSILESGTEKMPTVKLIDRLLKLKATPKKERKVEIASHGVDVSVSRSGSGIAIRIPGVPDTISDEVIKEAVVRILDGIRSTDVADEL